MLKSVQQVLKSAARLAVISGGLEASWLATQAGLLASARGRGAILTLHHVRPRKRRTFDRNAHLEITPDFLDAAIVQLKRSGYRCVDLADIEQPSREPVVAFTLDDGYRNTLEHAAPVFSRHGVPFTVFVTGGFVDRTHMLWWEILADLLEAREEIDYTFAEGQERLRLTSYIDKDIAFDRIAADIQSGEEAAGVARLDRAARAAGIDPLAATDRLTLDAGGIRLLADNPLARLGGHTISHRALARLSEADVLSELTGSADRIEAITGKRPETFAFPYGDRASVSARDQQLALQAGYRLAVTTCPGVLTDERLAAPTALPRISLNGYYQKPRYVTALTSGIPFKLVRRR